MIIGQEARDSTVTGGVDAPRPRRRRFRRWDYTSGLYLLLSIVATAIFFGIWQYAGTHAANGQLFFSSPSRVWDVAKVEVRDPEFWENLKISGQEFGIGFGLAAAVGIALGLLAGWYRGVRATSAPFVSVLYSTPHVALTPLLIVWFGLGLGSKVALVFLGAVFPIVLNLQAGIQNLDPQLVRVARSFGGNDWNVFRTVALPASIPFLITGLRLGVGRGVVGIVVGELIASQAGIGFYIAQAGASFRTDQLMFGICVIAFVGTASLGLLGLLEKKFNSWKPTVRP